VTQPLFSDVERTWRALHEVQVTCVSVDEHGEVLADAREYAAFVAAAARGLEFWTL
jgi:hypothetical protein